MWLTVVNVESVVSTWQSVLKQSGVVDASVEFAKIRKSSSAHPDNEIFVLITIVLWIIWVEFIHRLLPVRWMCRSVECWTTRHSGTSSPPVWVNLHTSSLSHELHLFLNCCTMFSGSFHCNKVWYFKTKFYQYTTLLQKYNHKLSLNINFCTVSDKISTCLCSISRNCTSDWASLVHSSFSVIITL